jgi:hypothetical protein
MSPLPRTEPDPKETPVSTTHETPTRGSSRDREIVEAKVIVTGPRRQ